MFAYSRPGLNDEHGDSADWINKIFSLTGETMPTINTRLSPITECLLGKSSAVAWSLVLCLAAVGIQSTVAQTVTEPAVVPTPLAGPCETRFDSNGVLWVEEWMAQPTSKIGRYDQTTGSYTEINLEPASIPGGLTQGTDGAVWFPEEVGNRIIRISPSDGALTYYPIPWTNALQVNIASGGVADALTTALFLLLGSSDPNNLPLNYGVGLSSDITTGQDGALWFPLPYLNAIGRFDPSSQQWSYYNLPTANALASLASTPLNIIKQGPGNLVVWIEPVANKIGTIDVTTKQIIEYPLPAPLSLPGGVNKGPPGDNNIWFTEALGQKIGKINPANGRITEYNLLSLESILGTLLGGGLPLPLPSTIAAGSDGNLYFVNNGLLVGGNTIFQFNPVSPGLALYNTPTLASSPCELNNQVPGQLWFGELLGNKIGKLTY
jgi:virginiamycin B lyase